MQLNPDRYIIQSLPPTGNILCITDPSGANIYLDGVLQPQITSTTLTGLSTTNHTINFTKPGYAPYSITIRVQSGQTVTAGAILTIIATITGQGIIVCTSPNIASCPISSISCPVSINPLNYVNLIATINCISPISLTVRFTYTINSTINYAYIPVNLIAGTNIIYSFSTNLQYPPNSILSLTSVDLV